MSGVRMVKSRCKPRLWRSSPHDFCYTEPPMAGKLSTVTRKRSKPPHRQATRKLQVVRSHEPVQPVSNSIEPPVDAAPSDLFEDLDDPAGMITAIGSQAGGLIAQARTALAAELALCELLGLTGAAMNEADPLREADPLLGADAQDALLAELVAWAEDQRDARSLALLSVIQVLGSPSVREAAAAAVAGVTASGPVERPWAKIIGRPRILRAWRYGDVLGMQDSVSVLFDYTGREHVLAVLIDHGLGGGVKDCWVAEGRDARWMRNHTAEQMSTDPMTEFEDLSLLEAAERLAAAVAQSPCPEQKDQIQDVDRFLPLLRSRLELLAAEVGLPVVRQPGRPPVVAATMDTAQTGQTVDVRARLSPSSGTILRLKVSLSGMKPPIWRRLEVSADTTLASLHDILQVAFGWTDSHLHGFERPPAVSGRAGFGRSSEIAEPQEKRTLLGQVVGEPGATLVYRYDFGDDWEHLITVEAVEAADDAVIYPRCTAGRRAGPPEDCGGYPGYEHLLAVLADPTDEEHDWLSEWVGGGFDPAAFDKDAVNTSLTQLSSAAHR
jgi:hypothetical protein